MVYTYSPYGNQNSDILFDLRQTREKIITAHLIDIKDSKDTFNYPAWYRNIILLYSFVHHLIKTKRKESDIDVEEKFNQYKKKTLQILNQYPQVYRGISKNTQGITEIEEALLFLEKFVLDMMEIRGVFGKSKYVKGL